MFSVRQIWAVALLTLREAARKKVFLVLLVFSIVLLAIFALMPGGADPQTRLRVVELWCLRSMTFFLAVIAIFLAAFSLPTEIEKRQIYLLASKPVSKVVIVLGKYLGYLVVLLLALAIMLLIGIGILRLTQDPRFLTCRPRIVAPRVEPFKAWWQPKDVPVAEATRFSLAGEDLRSKLTFTFENLDPRDFDMGIPVQMRFEIGTHGDISDLEADLLVTATNPDTKESVVIQCPEVVTNEWYTLPQGVPRTLIGSSGRLQIEVTRTAPEDFVILDVTRMRQEQSGVAIFQREGSFELNLIRGGLLLFFQTLFLMSLSITASTLVSGQVATFLAIAGFLICSMYGFMEEALDDIKYSLDRAEHGEPHVHQDLPPWLLKVSSTVSRAVLSLVPNFGQMDPGDFLLEDLAIGARELGRGLAYIGLRCLLLILIGCLFILLRDFH